METYNGILSKLISSLKTKVSSGEPILKDCIQHIYLHSDVELSPVELREYIILAEFEEECSGDYFMVFTLPDLDSFTPQEREAFCDDETSITVGIWIDRNLCKGVDTDNGICDEEPWQYTWHGN